MQKRWVKLDNAAKIFPAAARGSNTQVFRISCELKSSIDPALLQQALYKTAAGFPAYQFIMRRGLFWYYLESTTLLPEVHRENKPPCSPIYSKSVKSLLYEVSYYNCRINLEVFHVLSDGTGGMFFLTTLVAKYLALVNGQPEPPLHIDASHTQMLDDSFSKYYAKNSSVKMKQRPDACRLRGLKHPENRIKLVLGLIPLDKLRAAAADRDASITQLLCACLMRAICATLPAQAKKKPVTISVPVNLRNHFPSVSLRNFFGVLYTSYDFSTGAGETEEIIRKIKEDFEDGLTPERLAGSINAYGAMEHNWLARIVPLQMKNLIMGFAYRLSRRKVTAALSNVGAVTLPDGGEDVASFQVCAGSDALQASICSFKNELSIGITSPFVSTDVARQFFRTLTEMGIPVTLSANTIDGD